MFLTLFPILIPSLQPHPWHRQRANRPLGTFPLHQCSSPSTAPSMRVRHPGCSQELAGASYTQASKPAWTDRGQRLDARGQLGRRGQPSRGQAQAAASQLVGSQGCRVVGLAVKPCVGQAQVRIFGLMRAGRKERQVSFGPARAMIRSLRDVPRLRESCVFGQIMTS